MLYPALILGLKESHGDLTQAKTLQCCYALGLAAMQKWVQPISKGAI